MSSTADNNISLSANVRDDDAKRLAFSQLGKEVFGFNFDSWYRAGFWPEEYMPHVVFYGDRAVSSVSASCLDLSIDGERKRCIQLGSVMTAPDFRGRGLSIKLIEHTLDAWEDRCDQIHLFASPQYRGLYHKLEFNEVPEYTHTIPNPGIAPQMGFKHLDMSQKESKRLLYRLIKTGNGFSRVKQLNCFELSQHYLTSALSDCIYYSAEYDIIVIVRYSARCLICIDILGENQGLRLADVFSGVATADTNSIVLCFPPLSSENSRASVLQSDDALMVSNRSKNPLKGDKFMIPLCSRS